MLRVSDEALFKSAYDPYAPRNGNAISLTASLTSRSGCQQTPAAILQYFSMSQHALETLNLKDLTMCMILDKEIISTVE